MSENPDTERQTIMRRVDRFEEVEIPEGHRPCGLCKGKGSMSKYDLGWRSVTHDPSLSAQRMCLPCGGDGFVLDDLPQPSGPPPGALDQTP